jgi:hypothetical protein
MSERVSDPLAKYAKRIQSGRDAIAVKRPTAWDVAVVEFADALLDSRARVKELEELLKLVDEQAPGVADQWRSSIGERLPFRGEEEK